MKNYLFLACFVIFLSGCKESKENNSATDEMAGVYEEFGEDFNPAAILSAKDMEEKYASLKPGDTVEVVFKAAVNSVCKMKGCWMVLDLPGDKDPMVQFKDYAFFVPKDIEGREAVVNGKAYIEQVSVEDQKHFAKDAGKTEEEIAAIAEPENRLAFMADGVKLKE